MIVGRVLVQVHIINADHFASVNVNNLLIEQIPFQQKEALGLERRNPLGDRSWSTNPTIDGSDIGEGQKAVAVFSLDQQGGYTSGIFLRAHDQFADASGSACRIRHPGAQKLGQGQAGHGRRIQN